MNHRKLTIYTDGGARGNPGPAGIGYIISDETNTTIARFGQAIGVATNNEAEYMALTQALLYAAIVGKNADIFVFADSELMISQLNGIYKVKVPKLKEYYDKIKDISSSFKSITFTHVKREKNKDADKLVNEALDGRPVKDFRSPLAKINETNSHEGFVPENAVKAFSGVVFDVYQWDQELFDNSHKTVEAIIKRDSSAVIAITKERKIILLHQEQPGRQNFTCVPGGRSELNETPERTALRELREKTGYVSNILVPIAKKVIQGDIMGNVYIYLAKDCILSGNVTPDVGEKINVQLLDIDEFIKAIQSTEFRDIEIKLFVYEYLLQKDGKANLKQLLFD